MSPVADACNPAIAGCKPESSYSGSAFAWTVLVVVAIVAVALALLLWMFLRRRRTARRQPSAHQPGAGWFSDPTRRFGLRYWDGTAWTESVSNGGATEADPVL
jgi:hypothetical protein